MVEINWKCVDENESLWEKLKEIKEKEKEKKREDILLISKDENIRNTDSRDWVVDAEIFRENTGYVPKSSISELPEINIKNP